MRGDKQLEFKIVFSQFYRYYGI